MWSIGKWFDLKKGVLTATYVEKKIAKEARNRIFELQWKCSVFVQFGISNFDKKCSWNKKKSFFGVAGNSILTNWNPEIFWLENQENVPVAVAQLPELPHLTKLDHGSNRDYDVKI